MIQIIKNVLTHFYCLPFRNKRDLVAAMITLFFTITFPIGIMLVRPDLTSMAIVLVTLFPIGVVLITLVLICEANGCIDRNVLDDKLVGNNAVK